MSRSYNFAVEAKPVETEAQASEIQNAIDNVMGSDTDYYLSVTENELGSTAFINGTCYLGGGRREYEAHTDIVHMLRNKFSSLREIQTKWLCTEYQEWDEQFTWVDAEQNAI
jgi:hypothetical protein